jgi:hypothetical protein
MGEGGGRSKIGKKIVTYYLNGPLRLFFIATQSSRELIQVLDQNLQNWITQYTIILGQCYTYNIPTEIKNLGVRRFVLEMKKSVIIYLHHPGQFSRSDSSSTKIVAQLGEDVNIELAYDVRYSSIEKFIKKVFES